jgi:hypothetical protein
MKIIAIILLVLLVILLIGNLYSKKRETFDNVIKKTYSRNKCDYIMNENLKKVLENNKIEKVDIENAELVFPCTYDEIPKEIEKMPDPKPEQKIYLIDNSDEITSKEALWRNVLKYYGMEQTLKYLPNTYVLSDKADMKRLEEDYNTNHNLYIMKKNIQRQEGLYITNKLEDIMKNKEKYMVVQTLLQDPFLIKNRKINMRFYTLLIIDKNIFSVYVYNNGFMYYTKEEFQKNSIEQGPNITTGYIDRKVYEENPLTHMDFRKYLEKIENNLSNIVFNRINNLIKNIFISYTKVVGIDKRFQNNLRYQLFGVDIALNDKLEPMVMEINKGPDMGAKDKRDGELKYNCLQDILKLINIIENTNNGFIQVYSQEI